MPINGARHPLTETYVDLIAPDAPGVYGLYDGQETIYYGRSEHSIRGRLREHLAGRAGAQTRSASHFGLEITPYPMTREGELLREHQAMFGQLPRCNDRLR